MGYINADTIKRHKIITHYPGDYHNGWNDAIDEILEDERADVQEVKHGEWLCINGTIFCSECQGKALYARFMREPLSSPAVERRKSVVFSHIGTVGLPPATCNGLTSHTTSFMLVLEPGSGRS